MSSTDSSEGREGTRFRQRLIAPCTRPDPMTGEFAVDIPALLRRLLLFNTYILHSVRLKEIAPLVRTFGPEKTAALLSCGALQLDVDCVAMAQIGQLPDGPTYSRGKPPLPPNSFAFSVVRGARYNEYLLRCIADIRHNLSGWVSQQALAKVEAAALNAVLENPSERGILAVQDHTFDLRANKPTFRKAVAIDVSARYGLDIEQSAIQLRIIPIDETDFKVESNLAVLGLTPEEEHKCLERSLLANAGLKLRIEDMRLRRAISGAVDNDLPLFDTLFDFLEHEVTSGIQEQSFSRVLRIRKLPSLELARLDKSFDMEGFLAARGSKECLEFRSWLATLSTASDRDIADQINTVRAKLGPYIQGPAAKVIRLAVSTVAGLVPVFGTVAGIVLSTLDTFVVDRIFPVSGPTLFLSRSYRSLFG